MTLLSSLNTALSGLQATMAALQTTGHNIANANTPGFARQRVELAPQRPADLPRFQIGRGVSLVGVRRDVDSALEARLRDAASALSTAGSRSQTLQRLEALFGALSGTDLGSQLDRLFRALQDLSLHPELGSARTQVLASAETLAQGLNFLDTRIREFRGQLNGEVRTTVDEINRRAGEVAGLNREIVAAERAGLDSGAANDLRDRRDLLLRELSDLLKVSAVETSGGDVNVLVGSAFLVFGGESFEIGTRESADDGVLRLLPVFADGQAPVALQGGKLQGLVESRDGVLGGAAREMDVLAHALAFEFNRVQSTGQGLARHADLTSLASVRDPALALSIEGRATAPSTLDTLTDSSLVGAADPTGREVQVLSGGNLLQTRRITGFDPATGTLFLERPLPEALAAGDRYQIKELPFPVVNGSFDLVVTNERTGLQESFTISVDLDGLGADETWQGVVAQLDAASPGVSAALTGTNHIRLQSLSDDVTFSFARDTSGFLAAAGLGAFFAGSSASDLAVNPELERRPELLAAGRSNDPGDNTNALAFAALRDLAAVGGEFTFEEFYQSFVGGLGVEAAESAGRFETQAFVAQQLENQRERLSGVNIDEEAVHMIQFQRAFQASARFVGVIDDLLDTLINGI